MKIFLILGVILLVKQSLGETVITSNELTPNGKAFRDAVIAKLATLSEDPIKLAKQFFEDASVDKSISKNATNILTEILGEFEKTELEKPKNKIKAFLSLGVLFDILNGLTNIGDNDETKEHFATLKKALEKYDVKGVANEFRRRFEEFLEWLTLEFKEKLDKLTSEEQLRVKAFKVLWLQFKDGTDFAQRQGFLQLIMYRGAE